MRYVQSSHIARTPSYDITSKQNKRPQTNDLAPAFAFYSARRIVLKCLASKLLCPSVSLSAQDLAVAVLAWPVRQSRSAVRKSHFNQKHGHQRDDKQHASTKTLDKMQHNTIQINDLQQSVVK